MLFHNDIDICSSRGSNNPKNRASKYMKLKLRELQRDINKSTIIVGDVNTFFSITDGHKINNIKKKKKDKKHHQPIWPDRYLWNTSLNIRIYILCKMNIYQYRQYPAKK